MPIIPKLLVTLLPYLASIALSHVWYLPLFFKTSSDDILMTELIGGVLDSLTVFPFMPPSNRTWK